MIIAHKIALDANQSQQWMRDVTKNAPQQAIKNLGTAFKNVFAGTVSRKARLCDGAVTIMDAAVRGRSRTPIGVSHGDQRLRMDKFAPERGERELAAAHDSVTTLVSGLSSVQLTGSSTTSLNGSRSC